MKGVQDMPKTKVDELMEQYVKLEEANYNLNLYLRRVEEICEATGNGLWAELEEHFDGLPGYGEAKDED